MDCPKCLARGVVAHMVVTNTYRAGAAGTAQRLECPTPSCGMIGTAVQVLVSVEPVYGEGAGVLARNMQAGRVKIAVVKTKSTK